VTSGAPALELADVRGGYGRIEVLKGLSLVVPDGAVVALLGPNGVGKTTTLRAITGTVAVWSGHVRLDGREITNRRPSEIARRGAVLVPEGRGVFPGLTVLDNLRIAHRSAPADARGPWEAWLEEIVATFPRLGERFEQLAGSLSGGEQQMLALCRALVGRPRVLLLDELSMGLAPLVVEQLFDHVRTLRETGHTIVLVEQYLTHALRLADLCYVLSKGSVVWVGDPGELRHRGASTGLLAV
jgi:branched-chain amino acid transport system ATP-binding protein